MAGEMEAVGDKLRGSGGVPETAVEEDHDRCRFRGRIGREIHVRLNRALRPLLIDVGGGVLEDFPVTGFSNGGYFLQNSTHAGGNRPRIFRGRRAICLL